MDSAQRAWLDQKVKERESQPEIKKKSKKELKQAPRVREPNRGWLAGAIEMTETAIRYGEEGTLPEYLPALREKLNRLHLRTWPEIGTPEYDPDLFDTDVGVQTVFYHPSDTEEEFVRFLRWDCQQYMPYLKGKTIGGANEITCLIIIKYYIEWAHKKIAEVGPRGLLADGM